MSSGLWSGNENPKLVRSLFALVLVIASAQTAFGIDSKPGDFSFLANLDFSPALAKLDRKAPDSANPFQILSKLSSHTSVSEPESLILSSYTMSTGWETDLYNGIEMACLFHNLHGRLPKDGVELFSSLGDLKTISLLDTTVKWDDRELTPDERLSHFPMIINALNPATGRMIDSYETKNWQPFGINLTKTGKTTKSTLRDMDGRALTSKPAHEWILIIYGEKFDSILVKTKIYINEI